MNKRCFECGELFELTEDNYDDDYCPECKQDLQSNKVDMSQEGLFGIGREDVAD